MSKTIAFLRIALIIVVVMVLISDAQAETEIFGYFEPQFMAGDTENGGYQLNINKLRLDIKSHLTDKIIFTGNIDCLNYNGLTAWDYSQFLPDWLLDTSAFPLPGPLYPRYIDEIMLDNSYIRIYQGNMDFTVGKQQFRYGSGYAWNPTDIFNQKNVLDPTYEQPGISGMRLDVGLFKSIRTGFFYSPAKDWQDSRKLVRLYGTISHFDLALLYGWKAQTLPRTDIPRAYHIKDRNMYGIDVNGDLLGLGIWAELTYNDIRGGDNYWENIVGIDYTFESGWYVMSEFYHNEVGKKDYFEYSLNHWCNYFEGKIKTMGRDQLYFYSFYPITDLIDIGGSVIHCVFDKSSVIVPSLEYSLEDDLTLTIYGNLFVGKEGTMYSENFGRSVLFRLRAYF